MKKGVFIETGNVTRMRTVMRQSLDTERGRPGMVAVWGAAGLGKTLTAQQCYAEHGGVYLRAWEDWSQSGMLQSVCESLGGGTPHGSQRCKRAIIKLLDDEPGQVIFMDEADRLAIKRIEDLRDIYDCTGTPIVLIGEPGLPVKLDARERIGGRIPDEYRVAFEKITATDILLYAQEAAGLSLTPEACALLAQRSQGVFRKAHNMLLSLEQAAAAAETHEVDAAMVRGVRA
ncbi:MAG: AAA family ATPase [Desulfovibrionaceae bacterium]